MTVVTLTSYYKQLLTFFGKCDKNIYLFILGSFTISLIIPKLTKCHISKYVV